MVLKMPQRALKPQGRVFQSVPPSPGTGVVCFCIGKQIEDQVALILNHFSDIDRAGD